MEFVFRHARITIHDWLLRLAKVGKALNGNDKILSGIR